MSGSNSNGTSKIQSENPARTGGSAATSLYKIGCFEMALFYLYAAYVQINDPDTWLWMSFYLWNCGICLYSTRSNSGPSSIFLSLQVVMATVALGANNGGSMSQLDLDPDSEVGRENMGLMVVAFWFSLLAMGSRDNFWYSLFVFLVATCLCLATGLVPMLIMNKEELVEHCQGMGPFQ